MTAVGEGSNSGLGAAFRSVKLDAKELKGVVEAMTASAMDMFATEDMKSVFERAGLKQESFKEMSKTWVEPLNDEALFPRDFFPKDQLTESMKACGPAMSGALTGKIDVFGPMMGVDVKDPALAQGFIADIQSYTLAGPNELFNEIAKAGGDDSLIAFGDLGEFNAEMTKMTTQNAGTCPLKSVRGKSFSAVLLKSLRPVSRIWWGILATLSS